MNRQLRICAAFLVTLALFNLTGTIQSVTAADKPHTQCVLRGRVLSLDGKPIVGATVSAYIYKEDLAKAWPFTQLSEPVKSDRDGRFLIRNLYSNNVYILRAKAAGYELHKCTDEIHVGAGEAPPVEIRMREAPAFVAGKVVDAQGNPVVKSHVGVEIRNYTGCFKGSYAYAETDAEGNFRIDSLFTDEEVEIRVDGTTLKTKPGVDNLRIVVNPKS